MGQVSDKTVQGKRQIKLANSAEAGSSFGNQRSILGKAFNKDAGNIAYLRAAQTALAVERYRLAHDNQLPESLQNRMADFINAIPADPFDGRPFRYKKLTRGYVVYSVGGDREDDGGKEKQPGDKSESGYDLTFTVAR